MKASTLERAEVRRPGLRLRLGDLALWVVAAAILFALARGARGFWLDWGPPGVRRPFLDVNLAVGVALLAPATLIGLRLLLDALRPAAEGRRRGFATAWRLAGVAFLAGMALLISRLAREEVGVVVNAIFLRTQWQIRLATLGLALGTIGLLLGVVPQGAARPARPRRWVGASVILAGLAGVAMLASWGESLLIYLIFLALDAVAHAKFQPALTADVYRFGHPAPAILTDRSLWPSLEERLTTAGLAATVALFVCGLTAHWLARDLGASPEARRRPRSRAGLIYRGATALAVWGVGIALIITLPGLHEPIHEGLWTILGTTWPPVIVATFLALAAGLSARGVAGPLDPDPAGDRPPRSIPGRWLALALVRIAIVGVLVLAILGAMAQLRGDGDDLPWWAPVSASTMLAALLRPFEWTTASAIYLDPNLTPDAFVPLVAAVVIAVLMARLLISPRDSAAPIDRIARDPRLIGRFLGAWLAMTGVMLALLPTFFLGGMALLHFTMKAYHP